MMIILIILNSNINNNIYYGFQEFLYTKHDDDEEKN